MLQRYFAIFLISTISITLSPTAALSQTQSSLSPTFDIASIHPRTYAEDARTHISNSPKTSEFKAINVTPSAPSSK